MTFRVFSATLASAVCFLLGAFVYSRAPNRVMNRSFFAFNIGLSLWAIGDLLVTLAYTSNRYLLALWFDRLSYIGAIIVAPFFMAQLSALVDLSKNAFHHIIKRVIYVAGVVLVIFTMTPWVIRDVTLNPFEEQYGPLFSLVVVYFLGGLSYGIYLLLRAYNSANSVRQSQIKYFAIAVLLGLIGAIVYFVSAMKPQFPPIYYYLEISYALVVAYAILAHRLMDISVIVRKTLIYSAVTGTLTVLYLGIIALFARVFQGMVAYQPIYSSAVAAVLITIFFQPLRRKVQTFVDAKFFRQYVDREEKLYELSREVITHTTPEAMGEALMHVIDETLHPKQSALYLRSQIGNGFDQVSRVSAADLPKHFEEDYVLATFFRDNPQPFLQDLVNEIGQSYSTRTKDDREDAA